MRAAERDAGKVIHMIAEKLRVGKVIGNEAREGRSTLREGTE